MGVTGSLGHKESGLPRDLAGGCEQRFPQYSFLYPRCPRGKFCVEWVQERDLWYQREAESMFSSLQRCCLHAQRKDCSTDRSHLTISLNIMFEGFHRLSIHTFIAGLVTADVKRV